jgi:hypothetical protein
MTSFQKPQTHQLKCWTEYFFDVQAKNKKFELRLNDRDYKCGDILILNEYDNSKKEFTGKCCSRVVDYILYGTKETEFLGLKEGYCIMSLS